MSAARKAWVVAATIGAVEALKDQGVCRWNYAIRSLHQHAKSNIRSFTQAKILSSPTDHSSSVKISNQTRNEEKMKKSEQRLEKVMHLSCWGPNTIRF